MFASDTRIIFNPDGSYVWRAANGEGPLRTRRTLRIVRATCIGDKGAKLYVRGTVAGIFTVYSPTDIEIENDLVYAKDPRRLPPVARFPRADLRTRHQGRQLADHRHRRPERACRAVRAPAFHRSSPSTEGKPGTLFIFGSLTAGTILETEPRYATKMDYDKRFEYLRPANFPMTRRYEVDSWDGTGKRWKSRDNATNNGLARSE